MPEASSGGEAVALLAGDPTVSLMIPDLRFTGRLTGWGVAERYRAAMPRLAVIYASANPVIEARRVVGGIFFGKPTRMRDLLQAGKLLCQA
jgi:hypothetical protein